MEDLSLYFLWAGMVGAGVSAVVYLLYALHPRLPLLPSAN